MTTVLSYQPGQALPANNNEHEIPHINGFATNDAPNSSHRSTHSASSGEGLSMRDTSHNRNRSPLPTSNHTQTEASSATASQLRAAPTVQNGETLASRPKGQLVRANTDHGPRGPKDEGPEENWELRHGWEDEYNSNEILAKLSTVSGEYLVWRGITLT